MVSVSSLVDDIMRMKCLATVQHNPDNTLNITAVSTLTKKSVTLKKVSPDTSNSQILQEIMKQLNS